VRVFAVSVLTAAAPWGALQNSARRFFEVALPLLLPYLLFFRPSFPLTTDPPQRAVSPTMLLAPFRLKRAELPLLSFHRVFFSTSPLGRPFNFRYDDALPSLFPPYFDLFPSRLLLSACLLLSYHNRLAEAELYERSDRSEVLDSHTSVNISYSFAPPS